MLLQKEELERDVRLVGVSISNLQNSPDEPCRQLSLFDELECDKKEEKKKFRALENTIFDLHTKYGRNILQTGKELEIHKKLYNDKEEKV